MSSKEYKIIVDNCRYFPWISMVFTYCDEPEPSWLEPLLELKYFQLGSARDHFASARTYFFQLENQKIGIFCCPEKKNGA